MRVPIIGGGPAGMSCALWLHNYGLRPVIIERRSALGGMARANPYPNDWLLGRPGERGRDNAEAFVRHVEMAGIEAWLEGRPLRLARTAAHGFEVAVACAGATRTLSCPVVVIATGTEFAGEAWLDQVENARALAAAGRVQLGPSEVGEPGADVGARVAVLGGGDNAFDVARILAARNVRVTVVMRDTRPRARPQLVTQLAPFETAGRVRVVSGRTVTAIAEIGASLSVRLSDGERLEVDRVVVLFGYVPGTLQPWLRELAPALDPQGYLIVDGNMETSCPGLFAAGDVCLPANPCVASAVGSGAMAAREIERRLRTA
jgi:thioredoxin reductase